MAEAPALVGTKLPRRSTSRLRRCFRASKKEKSFWIETASQDCMTTAVEGGIDTFVFPQEDEERAEAWKKMARIHPIFRRGVEMYDEVGSKIGIFQAINDKQDLDRALSMAGENYTVVVEPRDWQIIPAENLVAAFQSQSQNQILAVVDNAEAAQVMLESLERGTDGIILRTISSEEVRKIAQYRERLMTRGSIDLETATIQCVEQLGMGDRACVDFCSILDQNEGLVVGNFARTLFLVASESGESQYISSRPFRVNAGPIHAYTMVPGGKTKYLSELSAGDEVLTINAEGQQQVAIVGRVKIERRPLVLIKATTSDGHNHSVILQNAETVKLISADKTLISVADIVPGEKVLVHRQAEARHTGIEINERIVER